MSTRLSTKLAGLPLRNPVLVCSGTFGSGAEYGEFMDLESLGALVTKSVTRQPRAGNPPPRIWETPSGLLNSIGLENKGVELFIREDLEELGKLNLTVIASVAGSTIDEYVEVAGLLSDSGRIKAVELNVSCPNVKRGGVEFGLESRTTCELLKQVKDGCTVPVFVKLSPLTPDLGAMAGLLEEAGADGLSLINTVPGMAVDVEKLRPRLGAVTGGLSGPAIHPVAVRAVWLARRHVKIPIIGMGGITDWRSALELMLVGADAVAVGTENFRDPQATLKIIEGLDAFVEARGLASIGELVGTLDGGSA